MYRITFVKQAIKELSRIDPIWQQRIKTKIMLLANDPAALKTNIKKLKGRYSKFARLRIGNYRIIFKILEKEVVILIIRIAHRREVY